MWTRSASDARDRRQFDTIAAASELRNGDENHAAAVHDWRPLHAARSVETAHRTCGGPRLCPTGGRSYSPKSSLPVGQGIRGPAAWRNLPELYRWRHAAVPDATCRTWLHGW